MGYKIYNVALSKQKVIAGERLTISVDIITRDWLETQMTWNSLKNKFKWSDLIG